MAVALAGIGVIAVGRSTGVPLIALVLWFGVLTAGEVLFDWTA
jgi:hypothetical protein